MASNIRRKSSASRTVQELAREREAVRVPAKRKPSAHVDEAEEVRQRIELLECVITTSPAQQMARRMAMVDILPASDEQKSRKQAPKRRPMQSQVRARNRSMGLLAQVLILALVTAAVAGWLNQRFHFLN